MGVQAGDAIGEKEAAERQRGEASGKPSTTKASDI
jgi:hypothetical protein